MRDALVYGIELLVGLGCLALGVAAWRQAGAFRLAGVVFAIAGLAAVLHAAIRLGT